MLATHSPLRLPYRIAYNTAEYEQVRHQRRFTLGDVRDTKVDNDIDITIVIIIVITPASAASVSVVVSHQRMRIKCFCIIITRPAGLLEPSITPTSETHALLLK